jgi:predicted ATPase/DNA-binding SARP family transcriptional activator
VEFLILGPLEVRSEGEPMVLAGRRQRALLALLFLRPNEAVSVDALVEGLWGESPPKTASHALQVFVSDLRKAFRGAGEDRIATQPPGYLIRVEPDELDLHRFERLATEGRSALARDDPAAASAVLAEALALWRGGPLADFAYEAFAQEPIARLEELRLSTLEDRIEADLKLGKQAELIGELEALTAKHPYREGLRHHLMLALYRAGRQSEALGVYQATRKLLLDELGIDPDPALQELERAVLVQDPALKPPDSAPTSEEKRPTNLPVPPTPLVGRKREREELSELLAREEVRLVTLTGPGGTGKTRLALEVCADLAERYRSGVYFVRLATVMDPVLVLPTVAHALGVREVPGESMSETLPLFLGRRELLLLLDNFEQVVEAAPAVGELLGRTPRVKVLVTSRTPLRLAGEHEYAVPPLALPDAGTSWQLEELQEYEAVRLFMDRALAVKPELAITEENAAAIAEICLRLDGLPLALELAAARLRVFSPKALLARLDQRLVLLTGGVRDADERHQTLRATIEWSYRLLDPAERALFARSAVFAGGCTLPAAEAVCGQDDVPVVEGLAQLVEQSLLRRRDDPDEEPRFWMLETIREYARERLLERDDADAISRRHAEYFLHLAAETARDAVKEPRLYERLEYDNDNLRATVAWCIQDGERTHALAAITSLWDYWLLRGYVAEGDRWARQLIAIPGAVEAKEEGTALGLAGELARFAGEPGRAAKLKEAALEQRRGLDPRSAGHAARDLALILLGLGDVEQAEHFAQQALELQTSHGDPTGVAHALYGVASVEWHRGRQAKAITLLEQAARTFKENGSLLQSAYSQQALASYLRQTGSLERARTELEEALTTLIRNGDILGTLWCLRGFGSLAADEGNNEVAARVWGATHSAARQTGTSFAEDPSDYDKKVIQARKALGDAAFERLWAEGATMTREEVERYVLEPPPGREEGGRSAPAASERA